MAFLPSHAGLLKGVATAVDAFGDAARLEALGHRFAFLAGIEEVLRIAGLTILVPWH